MVAFVRARLDEDEARARRVQAALDDGWNYFDETPTELIDPARALREVEAKRDILTAYVKIETDGHRDNGWIALRFAVETLAAIWSDHPDFRPEWAP